MASTSRSSSSFAKYSDLRSFWVNLQNDSMSSGTLVSDASSQGSVNSANVSSSSGVESDGQPKKYYVREQDRFLPICNVGRIMKRAIPENGKISREARLSIQECVSEFISFITSEAAEICKNDRRKTIAAVDVLKAMHNLDFDNYMEPLVLYLKKYRAMIKGNPDLSIVEVEESLLSECKSSGCGGEDQPLDTTGNTVQVSCDDDDGKSKFILSGSNGVTEPENSVSTSSIESQATDDTA